MDEKEALEAISAKGAELDAAAVEPELPWYKKIFKRPRRVTLKYRWRVLIAFGIILLACCFYMSSFISGNPAAANLNTWTDGVVTSTITWIVGGIGGFFRKDLSGVATGLSRIFTFGPMSYVLFISVIAFVIAGIVALIYSQWATAKVLDDGSPNFEPL